MNWLDVDHVYNMDCIDGMDKIEPYSVDLVLTDPPYNVDYKNKSNHLAKLGKPSDKQVKRDKSFNEADFPYTQFAFKLKDVMKHNSHLYLWCADDQMFDFYPKLLYAGFKFRQYLVWVKNRQTFNLSLSYGYSYKTELCTFWVRGSKKLRKAGLNNILKYNVANCDLHPTQKPLQMFEELIINSTNEGDLVFDPFMGSGTTAVACMRTNRHFIGFEISPEYHKIIENRINNEKISPKITSF